MRKNDSQVVNLFLHSGSMCVKVGLKSFVGEIDILRLSNFDNKICYICVCLISDIPYGILNSDSNSFMLASVLPLITLSSGEHKVLIFFLLIFYNLKILFNIFFS